MDEYDTVVLEATVEIAIQVRKDHRREDLSGALARLGVYLNNSGPINSFREDNGLLRVHIGTARHIS